jgi:predicted nucleic acid-binding Zn ribbon protein
MSERRRSTRPQRLGDILQDVLKEQGFETRVRQHRIMAYWEDFVGKEIAQRTRPTAIERGTLFVVVENNIWMHELHMLKDRLKDEINTRLGSKEVERIHLQIGRVKEDDVSNGRNGPP